ncbi:hypothetical protein GIB67_025587, partial [Kingdonia uniflora]
MRTSTFRSTATMFFDEAPKRRQHRINNRLNKNNNFKQIEYQQTKPQITDRIPTVRETHNAFYRSIYVLDHHSHEELPISVIGQIQQGQAQQISF